LEIKKGDTVGDYEVIDLVGSGGMGAVYKIQHLITHRIEAMKLLPIGIGSESEQVQRFEREIQVQARLHHPNIAALYNAMQDGRSIALIMEYVEGESLQCMLERGRLPLQTSVDYAGQILDALAYAHEMGVVHRDVSPANIIITPRGTAKLTDFGLARGATDLSLTTVGVAMGSPWYMSPEQVRAAGEIDPRADIYGMGAVLYEMITGRKMFDADGSFAVMRAQMEVVPQPPSAYNPELPTALDEVVARALAKDPTARFQSAGGFRLALEAAMGRIRPSDAASSCKPASKRNAAAFRPALRLGRVLTSRASILPVLASAALVALVCTVLLWPKGARVAKQAHVPRGTAVSQSVSVTAPPTAEPAPPHAVAVEGLPETPVKAAKKAPRSAVFSAPSRQRPSKSDQSLSNPVSGSVLEPPATIPPSSPQEAPALQPDEAKSPNTSPVRAASGNSAELEAATQTPEEAKPQKTGNRFIRALSKLNPFRKGTKNDPTDPPAKKD